jgi:hypothetical protein
MAVVIGSETCTKADGQLPWCVWGQQGNSEVLHDTGHDATLCEACRHLR